MPVERFDHIKFQEHIKTVHDIISAAPKKANLDTLLPETAKFIERTTRAERIYREMKEKKPIWNMLLLLKLVRAQRVRMIRLIQNIRDNKYIDPAQKLLLERNFAGLARQITGLEGEVVIDLGYRLKNSDSRHIFILLDKLSKISQETTRKLHEFYTKISKFYLEQENTFDTLMTLFIASHFAKQNFTEIIELLHKYNNTRLAALIATNPDRNAIFNAILKSRGTREVDSIFGMLAHEQIEPIMCRLVQGREAPIYKITVDVMGIHWFMQNKTNIDKKIATENITERNIDRLEEAVTREKQTPEILLQAIELIFGKQANGKGRFRVVQ
jgi:hypothetical protein